MTKDMKITPSSGLLEVSDNAIIFGRFRLTDSGDIELMADQNNLRLGTADSHIYIGDGAYGSDLIFEQNAKIRALTGKILTLGQSDSSIEFATKSFKFSGGGTFVGEYDSVSDPISYNTTLSTLIGGSTQGSIFKGRLSGHFVFALHGNDDADSFVFASYTTNNTPSHNTGPNKALMTITRQGNLKLGNYQNVGVLVTDGVGNVTAPSVLSINRGGTNNSANPTTGKFIIFDGTKYTASAYDETSFPSTSADLVVTGAWQFTQTIQASITGNAATATSAGSATTATSAGKWTTSRTFDLTGDVTGSVSFDGSGNINLVTSLEDNIVTAGTYTQVTIDSKGRVVAGANAGVGDAATLNGLVSTDFLRSNVDTTKSSGYLTFNPAGTKSFLRAWESTGKAALGFSAKEDSAWISSGTYFDGTNWKQQNSGSTGTSLIIRLIPGVGVRQYAASSVGEGTDILAFNESNGVLLWDHQGKIPATNLSGTIASARLTGTYSISISGNAATATSASSATTAATATALATGRTISLTGDILATSLAFDGTSNLSISTAIGNDKVLTSHLLVKNNVAINADPYFEDISAWRVLESLNGFTFTTTTTGYATNTVVRGTTGQNARLGTQFTAIDRSRIYVVTARLRSAGTSNYEAYTGMQFIDSSGANILETANTYWYRGLINQVPPTSWTLYTFTVGDTGSGADCIIPSNAVKMAAIIILHTNGTTGYNEANELRLDETIGTSQLQAASVTGPKIANNSINDNHLTAGNFPNITGIGTLTSLTVNGTATATTFTGALNGNANTATKLFTARNFTLTGDVTTTAPVAFDGTGNAALNVQIASLPAISGANLTNLNASNLGSGTVANARIAGNYTGFTGITSSGVIVSTVSTGTAPFTIASTTAVTNLNADLLDGQHASAFAAVAHTHTIANISELAQLSGNGSKYIRIKPDASGYEARTVGELASDIGTVSTTDPVFNDSLTINVSSAQILKFYQWTASNTDIDGLIPGTSTSGLMMEGNINNHIVIGVQADDTSDGFFVISKNPALSGTKQADPYTAILLELTNSTFKYKTYTIWHSNNDGSGSTLDADLLDGQEGSYYLNPANLSGTIPSGKLSGTYNIDISGTAATATLATNATKLQTGRTITFTNDVSGTSSAFDGSANISVSLSLPTVGSAGTYTKVTTDTKGRVTAGDNPTTLSGYGITDAQNSISTTRSIPTTVDSMIEIGNFVVTNGALSLYLSVVVSDTNVSIAKTYLVNAKYNATANIWYKLAPLTTTGAYNSNDFDIDINVTNSTTYLRLRRSLGTDTATATVTIMPTTKSETTWNSTTATSAVTAPTNWLNSFYGGSGSGVDADLLDGQSGAYYLDYTNLTNKPTTVQGFGITNALRTDTGGIINGGNLQIGGSSTDTEVLLVPRGSPSAPSIAAMGNTDTGIWFNNDTEVNITIDGSNVVTYSANYLTRFGGQSNTTGSRALFVNAHHGTAGVFGATLSIGGYYDWAAGTFDTYSTTANENGSVIFNMQAPLTSPKVQFAHVQSTSSAAAQSNVTPKVLFEIWAPQVAGDNVANYFKLTTSKTSVDPIFEVTGSDTNVGLRLLTKGTGVLSLEANTDITGNLTVDSSVGMGGNASSTTRATIYGLAPSVTVNGTNNRMVVSISDQLADIATGIVDSGYRRGLLVQSDITDTNFVGTLTTQYGAYISSGITSGTGTITASYALYVNSIKSTGTINSAWAIYENSANTSAANFLKSALIVSSSAGRVAEKLYVTGDAKITGNFAVGGSLQLANLNVSGIYTENMDTNLYVYKNVAFLASTSSSVTGSARITLPVSWTGSHITIKLLVSDMSSTSASEITISAQNPASAWANAIAFSTGNFPGNTVRLAHDGTKCIILLGSTATIWSYPKILVKEVMVSQASISSFGSGYTVAISNSEVGVTGIVTPTINEDFSIGGYVASVDATVNTIALRDSNAELTAVMFHSEQNADAGSFNHIVVQNARGPASDNAMRTATKATFKTAMNLVIGTDIQAYDADLTAIAALSTNGLVERTGAGTAAIRALGVGATTSIITRADGDGRYAQLANANTFTTSSSFSNGAGLSFADASTPTTYLRTLASGGYGYIQAGLSAADTDAKLRIVRYLTTSATLSTFDVYAVTSTINGNLNVTGNTSLSGALTSQSLILNEASFGVADDLLVKEHVLYATTTNATPTEMFRNGSVRLAIPATTANNFEISVIGARSDASEGANEMIMINFKGAIANIAGTTSLVGVAKEIVWKGSSATAWDVAITADNTNDALIVTVTGAAAKTIRWSARAKLIQMAV